MTMIKTEQERVLANLARLKTFHHVLVEQVDYRLFSDPYSHYSHGHSKSIGYLHTESPLPYDFVSHNNKIYFYEMEPPLRHPERKDVGIDFPVVLGHTRIDFEGRWLYQHGIIAPKYTTSWWTPRFGWENTPVIFKISLDEGKVL